MKIDIWSDYVCPFCYVGKKEFERALEEFNYPGKITINYRGFQLDPSLKEGVRTDMIQDLADHYGISREQAQGMIEQAVHFAKEAGLAYDYKNMIPANTFDAHRVTYYAKEINKDKEIGTIIFKAHFGQGLDIQDQETLSNLAEEVGLNKEETLAMLKTERYADQVSDDMKKARELGIRTVPTFRFNDQYSISGAQSVNDFLVALKKASEGIIL